MAQPFAVKEHFNTQKKKLTNKFKDQDLIFDSGMGPDHMKSDDGLNVPPNMKNEIETNFNVFSNGDTQMGAFSPKNVQEDG